MSNINIKSLTYSYVSIKNFLLKPYSEGILDDTGLVLSEYKSLKSLVDTGKIQVSENDYNYIVSKLVIAPTYNKDEVNNLLDQKLNANGTAVSASTLTPGSTLTLTGGVSGSGVIDGDNVSINTTVDLSTTVKVNDSRISGWNTAATNSHTHSNKAILDATTASYTTADQTKLTNLTQFSVVQLTQAQYDALTPEQKVLNNVLYAIVG